MASTAPRLPEQFQINKPGEDFDVSELLSEAAGSHSPFGDVEFPVPPSTLTYTHPTRADRPNLGDGR